MVAEPLLEIPEGIAFVRLHEEHEIRIKKKIDAVDQCGGAKKEEEAFGDLLRVGTDVAAHGEENRVQGKQDMDGKAVHMHEIAEGKLRPGGDDQGDQRRRNTDGVEEIIQGFRRLEHVPRNEQDIDTAQMQRKVIQRIIAADEQTDHFKQLVGNDKTGQNKPGDLPAGRSKTAI